MFFDRLLLNNRYLVSIVYADGLVDISSNNADWYLAYLPITWTWKHKIEVKSRKLPCDE